ncbi:MAG: DUF302 domain-containing protein [Pseudomonadota bacterium]
MHKISTLVAASLLAATTAMAEGHMQRVEAAGTVSEAADRLVSVVEGAGATVFARVNHGAGAASVEMELADAELLIFGNPMLGTPVLQADITAGLVLPLRVLVHDDAGQTVFVYETPAAMLSDFAVPADLEAVGRMTGALGMLTSKAAGG